MSPLRNRDWRVGVPMFIFLALVLWLNYEIMHGRFGRDAQLGSCLFWRLPCP